MKKILFLLSIVSLFFVGRFVNACMPMDGVVYPSVDSMLKSPDVAIAVYKPESSGPVVVAKRVFGNSFSKENITFKTNETSCSTRTSDFKDDEYIVTIFSKDDFVIESLDLDGQFFFSFKNKNEAENKYREYIEIWNNFRVVDDNTSYQVVPYTLKPGLKNNDDVKKLQVALKKILKKGDDFKIDGSYGPMTLSAVKEFQEKYGLEKDGLAGKITQEKIKNWNVNNEKNDYTSENLQQQKDVVEEESQNADQQEENGDIVDTELKKILSRAKKEITNYSTGTRNYTDAYSVVVKYNNEILQTFSKSDPLYYSSHNGTHFVYYAVLHNGKYICVDDSQLDSVLEIEDKPNLEALDVSCK
jgi:hypothetical protein